jgi:hypothetical protein
VHPNSLSSELVARDSVTIYLLLLLSPSYTDMNIWVYLLQVVGMKGPDLLPQYLHLRSLSLEQIELHYYWVTRAGGFVTLQPTHMMGGNSA